MRWTATIAMMVFIFYICLQPMQALAVKIVVDPGHGGSDPGAKGVNGIYEKTVNMDIALKLRQQLLERGYEVLMTKESEDTYLSLAERVEITKQANADLFVSIHANAYPASSAVKGSMVLYYDNRYPQVSYPASEAMATLTPVSREFAQDVLDHMVEEGQTVDKGLLPSSVYVVRMGNIPSILVETAFLSNWEDATRLADDHFRSKMAIGIANGIEVFRPSLFPDLANHWARTHVLHLKDEGIIEGEYNRYYPDRSLTRAEFMTLLDRMFDLRSQPVENETVTSTVYGNKQQAVSYRDLQPNHWAYEIVKQASELGLLNGYPDGSIRPDQPITRGEVASLFDRLLHQGQPAATPTDSLFKDVSKSLWSANAIYRLRSENVIEGVTVTTFAPERYMTRAEIAAMLDKHKQKHPKPL